MAKRYSQEFKDQAVQKAMTGTGKASIAQIANEVGVGYSTLKKWIYEAELPQTSPLEYQDQRPSAWTLKQRLEAIQATYNMTESELGSYCRGHGIYPHHIAQWKTEFENMQSPQDQIKAEREEKRQLKAENKALHRELRRKEKALAEASALLILQKKAQAIWGDQEDT